MIDIDKLEQLATAATPGPWEASAYGSVHPTGRSGSIVTALTKSGMHDGWAQNAPFIAAADPATVLSLIAEVRALRTKLETPIAMKIKWSPLESTMIDGWSPEVAEDALSRGKNVTVYYGKTSQITRGAK